MSLRLRNLFLGADRIYLDQSGKITALTSAEDGGSINRMTV
ncbi:MAG: hypothetical protein AAF716_17820 [Cyanobacteria bacterium P01_D01_bin.1]